MDFWTFLGLHKGSLVEGESISMKKTLIVLLVMFFASPFFSDGGTFQKKRVSRFSPGKDSIGADIPANIKALIPLDTKSKKAVFMDAGMYKMVELGFMQPITGVKDAPSDFAKIFGRAVWIGGDYGKQFAEMQLDGVDQSRKPEIDKIMIGQFESTQTESLTRMKLFYKPKKTKSTKFPKADFWVQKWETEDDSPKEIWYDCFYYIKGPANVAEMHVFAVPNIETADRIFDIFLAKVNKIK